MNTRTSLLLISTALAALPVGVAAQEGPAAEEAAGADGDDSGIIIVSAQRRDENLQEVPVSVAVATGETLQSRGINSIDQLNQVAPSVQSAGGGNFSVRGVGTLSFAPTTEASVGLAIDEVNLGRPGLGVGVFDDIARVEALSGPQGLLFGKNASAGLLNVVTRRPELGLLGGHFDAEATIRDTTPGDSSGVILRGTLNVPVSVNSALRINTRYSYQNAVTQHIGTGDVDENPEEYGVRVKFLTEPTDSLEIYLIGEYGQQSGRGGQPYRLVTPQSELFQALQADRIQPSPNNFYYSSDAPTYLDAKSGGLQGTLTYTLANDWQLINVAAWKTQTTDGNYDTDNVGQDFLNFNTVNAEYSQFSNELRLAIPPSSWVNGQIGLYYFNSESDGSQQLAGLLGIPSFVLPTFPFCVGAVVNPGPPPNCNVNRDYALGRDSVSAMDNESLAAFGQLNFDLTDQLTLIAGGRVTHDKVAITVSQMRDSYFIPLGAPGTYSGEISNTNFSWKLGGQFQATDDVMLYGFYARGYKGPTFNDSVGNPAAGLVPIAPETNENLELGIKTSWLDNRLIFNLSAFSQNFDDYQVQSLNVALQTFIIQNAARLKTKGLEAQLIVRPASGLSINASATLLDAVFDDFPGAECYPGQSGCGTTNTFNAAGQRLPASAKFTSTVQGIYEFAINETFDGFVEANWYHRSSINFLINGAPTARIGTTDTLGASIGIQNDTLRVSLFCRNCTDERVPNGIGLWPGDAVNNNLQTTGHAFGVSSVRNFGASISFDF